MSGWRKELRLAAYQRKKQQMREASKRWRQNHPESRRLTRLKNLLKGAYNMSLETFQEMLSNQNGVCYVCKQANPSGKRLAIDHDHKTDKVRKLLCSSCNAALGLVQDDTERLRKLADYLDEHRC